MQVLASNSPETQLRKRKMRRNSEKKRSEEMRRFSAKSIRKRAKAGPKF